jgi:hydrogenase maturation protease
MKHALIDQIARAVLYEGYILYPYRPSVKNRQRWTFGGLYPQSYSLEHGGADNWIMQTECLVRGDRQTTLEVRVRFLHLMARLVGEVTPPLREWPAAGEPSFRIVEMLRVGDKLFPTWQEAVEREIAPGERVLADLQARPERIAFAFPEQRACEPLPGPDGKVLGLIVREQQAIEGTVELSAQPVADGLLKLTMKIANRTPFNPLTLPSPPTEQQVTDSILSPTGGEGRVSGTGRDAAVMRSLASTHTLLGVRGGEFLSLLDPPEPWRASAAACRNIGAWPVLVGEEGDTDTMLSAPIILYDYPRIAPESPGDLFDGTEIDEMLTLRILTLTDEEKQVMEAVDDRARALLHRTEALAREQLLQLHGTVRSFRPVEGGET